MNKNIIVIDTMSLLYKAFYGVRPMHSSDSTPTNAVYGFMNMLIKLISDIKPDYIFAASDASKVTFRSEMYSQYKAGRQAMPDEMRVQIPIVQSILEACKIKFLSHEGYEADDIIGYLATLAERENDKLTIVTGDRDSFQLSSENVCILYAKRGVSDTVSVTPEYIKETYNLEAKQLIDLKALMGDKSDNIPGVAGVGEKTALGLLYSYKSLDGVYENIEDIKGKLKDKLINDKENAYLSYKLGTILRELPFSVDYDSADDYDLSNPEAVEIFRKYELKNLLKYLNVSNEETQTKAEPEEELIISQDYPTLKDMENKTISLTFASSDFINTALAICDGEKNYLIKDVTDEFIKDIFENENIKKILHDCKPIYKILLNRGIKVQGIVFDTMVAAYVVNAVDERYDLDFLAKKYLDLTLEQKSENAQQSMFDMLESEDYSYLTSQSNAVLKLYKVLSDELNKNDESKLYFDIEHKLMFVLAEMENIGFRIDKNELASIGNELDERIDLLQKEILRIANKDESFNINSTKQLGTLLFDELGLPVIKKTKTGYSTDIEVLEALEDKHPIIPLIVEQRKLAKLNSTYVKGMIKLIDKDNRIHSTFNQTITTTGRISSSNPNLQNIPVKTEEGKVIRKVFVPKNDDYLLVSADYSQIELRVLAHIANDSNMIEAFKNNIDIHTKTASEVFGVKIEDVTKEQRSKAKAVNFGIVYGISGFGLGKNLKISQKEAKQYIDAYLDRFPNVQKYMKDIVEFAKENGYVQTLLGRRRYISEINSKNYTLRSFGERTALNTPIQGTAADIIKIAMVEVNNELQKRNMKSSLILQIHDELIIDAHKDEVDIVVDILRDKMEHVLELNVPLFVDISYGKTWYEAK